MKRALKIIIPIFLLIAIFLAAAWFFLSFRPDLTCQFFVNRAESALSQGNYARAVRYYDRAWGLYPEDADIAIALSNAHKQNGNYTKAEYTLVSAISSNPDDLELYLELSSTYVKQDKLLDADQMLSRTTNPAIKEQLDALRPAAPVIQPESGYYTEYIDISLAYTSGTAYLSIDSDFPSRYSDLYTEPQTLGSGESTVYAIVVSDDGLVSPAATAAYTIGGVIEAVEFEDAAVEQAIRSVLSKSDSADIMTNELWSLTTLELPSEIKTLNDLADCRALTSLTVHETYGIDFSILGKLTNLETLDLSNCTVSSNGLAAIASLPKLTTLKLSGCALTKIDVLSALTMLTTLDLSNNAISDIAALSGMTTLVDVNLSNNALGTIESLSSATTLQFLNIADNAIVSLSALNNKTSLVSLSAAGNQIADLSPLSTTTALQLLDVSNNALSDITAIAALPALSTLTANQNALEALPDFSSATALIKISITNNNISDISGLQGLELLNYVNVDYNNVSDLSPLLDCLNLVQIDAFANPVSAVDELVEHGVIVNYDPTYEPPEQDADTTE